MGKNLFTNADMESGLAGWELSGTGGVVSAVSSPTHAGNGAIRVAIEADGAKSPGIRQLLDVEPDSEYVLSAWVRCNTLIGESKAYPFVSVRYKTDAGKTLYDEYDDVTNLNKEGETATCVATDGEWHKIVVRFTTNSTAFAANLCIKLSGSAVGGEIFIDDVSVNRVGGDVDEETGGDTGEGTGGETGGDTSGDAPAAGTNLLKNGDMESMLGDWELLQNASISAVTDGVHAGNFAARIARDEGAAGNPWMRQRVNVLPNTEYVYSAWVKFTSGQSSTYVTLPVDAWNIGADGTATYVTGGVTSIAVEGQVNQWKTPDGEWHYLEKRFTTGPNVNSVDVYLRMYGAKAVDGTTVTEAAESIWDDVSLVQYAAPEVGFLDTDQWIYYSDYTADGIATVSVGETYQEIQTSGKVDFTFKDGDNVLKSETVNIQGGTATFTYPMSLLSQKQHEYTVVADVKDAEGTVKGSYTRRLFKYDRPNYLTKDGEFLDKDGNRIYVYWPSGTYMQEEKWSKPAYDAGFELIQAGAFASADKALESLNKATEVGVKVVLVMYRQHNSDGKLWPAAYEGLIEQNRAIINAVKDHPALFAYHIMDEGSGRANATDDLMIDTYRLIREIDPNHPIYLTENADFEWGAKVTDILGIDPYGRPETKTVAVKTTAAVEATEKMGGKPVVAMVQAFKTGEGTSYYFPEPNEGRLSLYQALLTGATGLSFYGFQPGSLESGKYLDATPLWPALVEFEEKDKVLIFDHFVYGDTPTFNHNVDLTKDVWYHSFVKDDDVYVIVTNSSKNANTVSVPLTSDDGTRTINGYTATVYTGADAATINGTGNTLDVTLNANTAVVYKVTPKAESGDEGETGGDVSGGDSDVSDGDVSGGETVSDNLFTNADMEGGVNASGVPTGWTKSGTGVISLVSTPTHSGSNALRCAIDATGQQHAGISQLLDVEPNTEYVLSAWVNCKTLIGTNFAQATISERYDKDVDKAGNQTGYITHSGTSNKEGEVATWKTADNEWHKIVIRFTTHANAYQANFVVKYYGSGVGGEIFVDDVSLVKVLEPAAE